MRKFMPCGVLILFHILLQRKTFIGFFCYSFNVDDNTGFLKFVIVDCKKRGMGYGKKMLQLALKYAFDITGVNLVQLNVFEENIAAKHCYKEIGFIEESRY